MASMGSPAPFYKQGAQGMGLQYPSSGGSGLGGPQGPQSQSVSLAQQKYAYPDLAATLAASGGGRTQEAGGQLMDFLSNPTAHPAYQNSLKGVLASLEPQTEAGYNKLSDQFRAAGAMQSGAYGTALGQYAGEVNRNQTMAASDVLAKMIPSIISGYNPLATQTPSLLDALKLSDSRSQSVAYPADSKGSGGMGSGFTSQGGSGGVSWGGMANPVGAGLGRY